MAGKAEKVWDGVNCAYVDKMVTVTDEWKVPRGNGWRGLSEADLLLRRT